MGVIPPLSIYHMTAHCANDETFSWGGHYDSTVVVPRLNRSTTDAHRADGIAPAGTGSAVRAATAANPTPVFPRRMLAGNRPAQRPWRIQPADNARSSHQPRPRRTPTTSCTSHRRMPIQLGICPPHTRSGCHRICVEHAVLPSQTIIRRHRILVPSPRPCASSNDGTFPNKNERSRPSHCWPSHAPVRFSALVLPSCMCTEVTD